MNIGTKKALGIVTCNRPDFYEEILETTPFDKVDKVYVFDSSPEKKKYAKPNDKIELIKHEGGTTVGIAKNKLWSKMIEDGMDHLYLQEDDVKLIDDNVFDLYLDTAKETGLWGSLSYAWHGDGNKDSLGLYEVKNNLEYDNGVSVDFTQNGVAAFTYHHAKLIKHIGMMDETYINAWEHLDHYQKVASEKLGSFWWWYPDAKDSYNFIEDLDNGSHGASIIRKDKVWRDNMQKGMQHFKSKFGFTPDKMPHATDQQVQDRMQFLKDQHSFKR